MEYTEEIFAFNSAQDSFDFRNTSVQLVLNKIGSDIDTVVKKGYFPETAKGLEEETFDFDSLDTDIYIYLFCRDWNFSGCGLAVEDIL